ncbi:TetR/AcrR family transcriptional regulator [Sphingomonas sp.]|uniref:TetR/AcrR family transcriptional regulator n=1 Tax=Sphingomonas sp. TaxID=28214 RepID=UPI0035BC02D8
MPRTGMPAAELRNRAIDLALAGVNRDGFEKVRLSDVARALGVSHAALYAHFDGRGALLDAVTARWLAETETALLAICNGEGAPLERIEQWLVERYRRKRGRARTEPEVYRAFDAAAALRKPHVQEHLAATRSQLARLLADAALPVGTPEDQAALLLEATAAFHHPKLIADHANQDREPLLRHIVRAMLASLR